MQSINSAELDQRPVFFFDIDDCLYPRSLGVSKMMYELLEKFVIEDLSISKDEAVELIQKYTSEHTLTVIGLQKLHQINPMVFNQKNDDALPMDKILTPDMKLRAMLLGFDPSKVKLWLFTNAYVTHGLRVAKLLGVDDLFEGITYCDYSDGVWPLKPHLEMFEKAEKEAGAAGPGQCYFVDDSPRNCAGALDRGWQVVRIVDPNLSEGASLAESPYPEITSLDELHKIYPQFLK